MFHHAKHILANFIFFLIFVAFSEEYQDVSTVASVERKSDRKCKISEMNLCQPISKEDARYRMHDPENFTLIYILRSVKFANLPRVFKNCWSALESSIGIGSP